jgi:hypothetical protein
LEEGYSWCKRILDGDVLIVLIRIEYSGTGGEKIDSRVSRTLNEVKDELLWKVTIEQICELDDPLLEHSALSRG